MNLLQAENVSKTLGDKLLFKDLSISVNQGQRIALIGKNGCGKSTLLRILAGKDKADSGIISTRKDLQMAYMAQEPEFNMNHTVEEAIFRFDHPQMNAIRHYEAMLIKQELHPESFDEAELNSAMEEITRLNAWEFEYDVKQILSKLNIHDFEKPIKHLSGGQLKRVALASVLISRPELFILDEPTNHLDVEMIEWLENYFKQIDCTLLMVTHDRYFLDNVCNEIIELSQSDPQRYKGNYAYYLEKKAERTASKEKEIEKARNTYSRELEWMRRMPKARGTKAKSRIDQFYDTEKVAKQRIQQDKLSIDVKTERLGGKILELHKISKQFGDKKLFLSFSHTFKTGEKVGLVGPNGSGKSTFINLLAGLEQADTGKIVQGETVKVGYYTQKHADFDPQKRVLEIITDIADNIPLADGRSLTAAQLLMKFLFPKEQHYTMVEKLSGGEKRRLYLLTILIKNPNFLILDEPTNDLDIQTLNVLHEFLESFKGCMIIVSHDRYFMDTLVDHLFIFDGEGNIKDYNGNYTAYREEKDEWTEKNQISQREEKKEIKQAKSNVDKKIGFKEKFEFEQLEKQIPELENMLIQLNEKLNSGISNHEELMKVTNELGEKQQELEEKTNRWLELSEIIN